MSAVLSAISSFGLPTVAAGVLIYILLRGELVFRYPRRGNPERWSWLRLPGRYLLSDFPNLDYIVDIQIES
jgi:hypothetical protein